MSERNTPPFGNKAVDLKPRGDSRVAHSQFGHFTPDEELIHSTARIINQRDLINERLEKMGSAQTRVSKTVFDKVRRDYALQLETINDLLAEKKHLLKEEIKKLYVNREKLSFEINRHREILEEAEFRHFLGEFTQTQYQEVENFETREIEKLEADLAHISQWVRTHEELFDPEDFGQKRPEKQAVEHPPVTQETVTVAKSSPAPQSVTASTPATQRAPKPTVEAKTVLPAPAPEPKVPEFQAPPPPPVEPEPVKQSMPNVDFQKTDTGFVPKPVVKQAEPEQELSSDSSETTDAVDEFSYLFEDDTAAAPETEDFSGTESNINALLSATAAPQPQAAVAPTPVTVPTQPPVATPEPVVPEQPEQEEDSVESDESLLIPDPEENSDYFQKEKVSEASFRISKPLEEDSVTASKEYMQQQVSKSEPVTAPSRQVMRPDPEKPVNRDESISNILDSIRFDDDAESKSAAPAPAASNAASSESEFKLILTQGDLDDKVFDVRENTSIGRSPSNDVVLKEPKVSRQHAAINKYNEHYIIIDLKSSNGVYVNGVKVDECVLHPGDEISIGGYKFQFQQA